MLPGGSTLGGVLGAAYGVASGAATLRGVVGAFYFVGTVCVFCVACGGVAMLEISAIF